MTHPATFHDYLGSYQSEVAVRQRAGCNRLKDGERVQSTVWTTGWRRARFGQRQISALSHGISSPQTHTSHHALVPACELSSLTKLSQKGGEEKSTFLSMCDKTTHLFFLFYPGAHSSLQTFVPISLSKTANLELHGHRPHHPCASPTLHISSWQNSLHQVHHAQHGQHDKL